MGVTGAFEVLTGELNPRCVDEDGPCNFYILPLIELARDVEAGRSTLEEAKIRVKEKISRGDCRGLVEVPETGCFRSKSECGALLPYPTRRDVQL